MSSNTVAEFARELNKTPDTLLQQLKAAGVAKDNASDALTDGDKQQLLSHLQASHGSGAKKITLTKRSTRDRKSTRLNSSHLVISYAVFCLKKKKQRSVARARRDTGTRTRGTMSAVALSRAHRWSLLDTSAPSSGSPTSARAPCEVERSTSY